MRCQWRPSSHAALKAQRQTAPPPTARLARRTSGGRPGRPQKPSTLQTHKEVSAEWLTEVGLLGLHDGCQAVQLLRRGRVRPVRASSPPPPPPARAPPPPPGRRGATSGP